MTVYEFCKSEGISHQAVYRKINSAPEKFKGHIKYKGRKKKTIADLDEYAMNILKPRLTKYDSLEESYKNLTSENSELLEKNEKLSSDLAELQAKYDELDKKHNRKILEHNDLVTKYNCMSYDNTQLKRTNERLKKDVDRLEQCIKDNEAAHRQELRDQAESHAEVDKELSDLRFEHGRLVDENYKLRKQIPKKHEKDGKFSLFKKNKDS